MGQVKSCGLTHIQAFELAHALARTLGRRKVYRIKWMGCYYWVQAPAEEKRWAK